jgi:hypothetical protein
MKKGGLIAGAIGLAVGLAVVYVYVYVAGKGWQKSQRTDGGFLNADGSSCRVCERADGTTYFATSGSCSRGGFCVVSRKQKSLASV